MTVLIVDQHGHAAFVPRRQEARQCQVRHYWVPHRQRGLRSPHARTAECDRHHAQFAFEIGDFDTNLSLSVGADFYRPLKQRHGARRNDRQAVAAHGVAAASDDARLPLRTVEQMAVIVADFHGEASLAEIILCRIGRNEAGQLQDALIDGRDGEIDLLARHAASHRYRQIDGLPRRYFRRQFQADVQQMRSRIDTDPGQPDCSDRQMPLAAIRGPVERSQDIGAATPVGGNGNLHRRAVARHVDLPGFKDLVTGHHQPDLAGKRRNNAQASSIPDLGAFILDSDLDLVGGVGCTGCRHPSGAETEHRHCLAVGRFDDKAIIAPIELSRQHRWAIRRHVDIARVDGLIRVRPVETPAAAGKVPTVMTDAFDQGPAQPRRLWFAVVIDRDQFEACLIALPHLRAFEPRPNANHQAPGADRQTELIAGDPAAGLLQSGCNRCLQGDICWRNDLKLAGHLRMTFRVAGLGFEINLLRFELASVHAKPVPLRRLREGCGIDRHVHVRFRPQFGGRRPVQEPPVDRKRDGIANMQLRRLTSHRHLEALRHEILHLDRGFADDLAIGIACLDPPVAAARGIRQVVIRPKTARRPWRQNAALKNHAVRFDQRQRQRAILYCLTDTVPQQGGRMDPFARPVDAALRVDKRIQRAGGVPPGDPAIGQVERRLRDIEDGEILLLAVRDNRVGGRRARSAQQAGGKYRLADIIRRRLAEDLTVACLQLDVDGRKRGRGAQRPGENMQTVGGLDRGDSDVGVHHELRGEFITVGALPKELLLLVAGLQAFGVHRDNEVDAGLLGVGDLRKRECGMHHLITQSLGFHRAGPNRSGGPLRQIVQSPAVALRLFAQRADHAGGEAIVDPQHFDGDGIDVHRIDGQARGVGPA